MKKLWLGMLLGLVFVAIGASVFVTLGAFPLAASSPPDIFDKLALDVRNRTIKKKAQSIASVPGEAGPESVRRGLVHYRENCLPCHSAPDASPEEFAQGLNPMPPALQVDMVQAWSDAELFWIIKNGLRLTGMPAFGINHKDDEIGDIVRFVRHLPKLTDEEKHELQVPPEGGESHHRH
jgi:mono/diheme cytochrome c family protein